MSGAELAAFRQSCERSDTALREWYDGYITVGGLRFNGFTSETSAQLPATWLVARRGAQHTICIRNGRGEVIGHTGFCPGS